MQLRGYHRRELSLPSHLRAFNRASLLQRLHRHGPASRAELARQIGLTKVTVSALAAELIDEGIIADIGPDPRSDGPGKRPTLLTLCEEGRSIVAVDLTREGRLSGAVMTLTGESMERQHLEEVLPMGDSGVDELTRFCRMLIDRAPAPMLGLGVATPGVIDASGTILRAPKRGWSDLPLQALLSQRLRLPVSVANDASCAALGEVAFGTTDGDSILSVLVGDGVGGGLVIDGSIIHGHGGAAGEIAHVTATWDGDGAPWGTPSVCVCERSGCLATLLSEPELRQAISGLSPDGAQRWLRAVGERLGAVLAPVVAVLDVSDIILAGPPELLDGALLDGADAALRDRVWPPMNPLPRLALSTLQDRAPLVGAGVLVLSSTLGIP